jgi:hypothetical protein
LVPLDLPGRRWLALGECDQFVFVAARLFVEVAASGQPGVEVCLGWFAPGYPEGDACAYSIGEQRSYGRVITVESVAEGFTIKRLLAFPDMDLLRELCWGRRALVGVFEVTLQLRLNPMRNHDDPGIPHRQVIDEEEDGTQREEVYGRLRPEG